MTTLEERRAWMRAGCPVETAPHRCFTFVLNVWPDKGEIRATCESCDAIYAVAGMRLDGAMVSGVAPVVLAVCEWLDQHGKADAGTAAAVLADAVRFESWDDVRQWAESMMAGRHEGLRTKCIPSEAVGQYPRGRYLYRLSPEPMFPRASGFRDDRADAMGMAAARFGGRTGAASLPFTYREPAGGEPVIAKRKEPPVFSSTYLGGTGSAGK